MSTATFLPHSNVSGSLQTGEENIILELDQPVDIVAPKLVFIVPYRDREQQQLFFSSHMKKIMEDVPESDYRIYYVHQNDKREFNRGALKNIGFLVMKEKYPNDYKNITFIFNDVDTMPYTKNFLNYETTFGSVKHFYGYKYTLGGIVSIKGSDFEKINGFPNFWAWGYEDNLLQFRVLAANIQIDRSVFYPIMDKNIMHMNDGIVRSVNRGEFDRYMSNTPEGINTINSLQYTIDETTEFIDVTHFLTGVVPNMGLKSEFDLRHGTVPFKSNRFRPRMRMMM